MDAAYSVSAVHRPRRCRSARCPPRCAQAASRTLAFFVKNVTNPFWKACRIGAEKAGKAARRRHRDVAPTKPDNIEEQTRLVEDWIVKKPDAFVFVPVDYKALVPCIQKANKAGIPVINYNNSMTDVDFVTYVGSDDETIEYEICKYLFKSMGGKGKIVHIDGVPAAITAQNRKKGFERAVKETRASRCSPRSPATTAGCRRCRCSRT